MNPHGIPPGLVWFGSSRYNNRVMTEDDMRDFYERAAMGRTSDKPSNSQCPIASRSLPKSQTQLGWPVRPNPQVSHSNGVTPSELREQPQVQIICSASNSRAALQGSPRRSNTLADVGSDSPSSAQLSRRLSSSKVSPSGHGSTGRSPPAWQPTSSVSSDVPTSSNVSEMSRNQDQVKENVFCDHCQRLITMSRTVHMSPKASTAVSKGGGVAMEVIHSSEEDREAIIETFPHHRNLEALQQSALDGCHLCSILVAPDVKVPEVPSTDSLNSYSLVVICAQNYDGPGRIEIRVRGQRPKTTYLSYDVPIVQIQGSLRHRRTDAGAVFKLARSWLDTCLENHENCRHSSQEDDFIPTRLLKVSASGLSLLSVQLCLTDSKDFEPRPRYLALSHCWGGADILKLTTSTLPTLLRDVPLPSLPRNFSEAALTTSRLGYKYLWIDSLCIIQDSPEDWAREAATMGNVYSSATCTIAALGAADSHSGCFVTRNPLALTPCLLRDGRGRDCVWADSRGLRGPDSSGEMRPPLHRRAWVVQERALAPRTLYFGSEMVFWECVTSKASEAEPAFPKMTSELPGRWPDTAHAARELGLKTTLHAMRDLCRSGDWADWESFWWKMVREYTESRLTFDSDRWTAFAGLAENVEQRSRTRLYHGLWESNLFEEMLWKVLVPGRRVDYDAPSWSWLSVDMGVHEQRYNYQMDFRQVATISIPPSSETSISELSGSGKLSVLGPLLRLTWSVEQLESGKSSYKFRLQDGREMHKGYFDGRWNPDTPPDKDWELSTLQFVTTAYRESYGLVVRPVDGSKTSWLRAGFYGMSWRPENYGDQNAASRYFGEIKTITLV